MQEIRKHLDEILNIIAQKVSFEDYEKVVKLVTQCNENLDEMEEWWYE